MPHVGFNPTMRTRRTFHLALVATALLAGGGCARLVPVSDLRPAAHPLLERVRWSAPATRGRVVTRDPARQVREILRRLAALEGRRTLRGRRIDDALLLREAFGSRARAVPRSRTARPKPADLLIFESGSFGRRIAIVKRVDRRGLLHAAYVTRGAVRTIVVDPARPNTRRAHGRIVNSFVRPRHRDDPPRLAYLAGGLLADIETLID